MIFSLVYLAAFRTDCSSATVGENNNKNKALQYSH